MTWVSETAYDKQAAVDNLTMLRQEIADAVLHNRPVLLPAGTYRIDCTPANEAVKEISAIEINGDVIIKGAGRSVTILRIGPDLISIATTLFWIHASKKVTFEDLTIEGPPYLAGSEPDGKDATACFGIYHKGGGVLTLRNVTMRAWNQCIKADALPDETVGQHAGSQLTLTDCSIGGRSLGLLQFDGDAPNPASLTVERCLIAHDANAYTGQHHNLYITDGVNITIRNCRFTKSVSYGIHIYDGRGRLPVTQPRIEDCEFDGAVARAILTNRKAKTIIRNCIFRNPQAGVVQITVRGDALIEGCHFEATQQYRDIYAIHDDQGHDADLDVKACSFGGSFLYYVLRVEENTQKPWRFTNCTFSAPLHDGFYLGTKGNVGKIEVSNSHFAESALRRLTNGSKVVEFKNCTRGPAFTGFSQIGE